MPPVRFPTSEVVIYETQGNGVILLVKKSSDQKYYLFLINSINGAITFDGIEGSSVFDTKIQALKTMQANYVLSMDKDPIVGQALIGAARYGPVLYVLVVKQSNAIARIQNAHTIFSVTESEFYRVNLHFHRSLTQQEQRRIDRIVEFPVAEYHMWCETKDLTVPLYSNHHDPSFLWNKHWTKTFEELGQKDVCINLLQGTATSQLIYLNPSIKNITNQYTLITDQLAANNDGDSVKISQSTPTIEKLSPDLNSNETDPNQPNNEENNSNISTASSLSSIPSQNIQNAKQANEDTQQPQNNNSNNSNEMFYRFTIISIRESVNGGTRYYARGIDDMHHPANEVQVHIIVESNDGKLWSHVWRRGSVPVRWSTIIAKNLPTVSISVHPDSGKDTHFYFDYLRSLFPENIQIVNLLHNSQTNSEYPLCLAYHNAVEKMPNIQYHEFDWHKEAKEKGISGAVKSLYNFLQTPEFTFSKTETDIPVSLDLENIQAGHAFDISYMKYPTQAIFFPNEISSNSKTRLNLAENEKVVLPEFGTSFSNIQKTTARINCMDSLDRTNVVSFFYAIRVVSKILEEVGVCKTVTSFEEVMKLPISIRLFLCDAFLGIGDCVSYLYTNTPACMTEIFHEVAQDDIKTKSDSTIAVKRRYHNFLTDRKRQKAYNMFLGKCFDIHIPNIDCSPLPICVSMGSAQFMQPYVNDGKSIIDPTNLLQISSYKISTIGCKVIIMMLSEACYVTDVYMIVAPPNPPTYVSISSALTLGVKTTLVEKVALPLVTRPQPVYIKIPPDQNNNENNLARFLIFEFDCRTLDAKGKSHQSDMMTISNIFVFGQRTREQNDIKKIYNFTYQQFPVYEKKIKPRQKACSCIVSDISSSDASNNSSRCPISEGSTSNSSIISQSTPKVSDVQNSTESNTEISTGVNTEGSTENNAEVSTETIPEISASDNNIAITQNASGSTSASNNNIAVAQNVSGSTSASNNNIVVAQNASGSTSSNIQLNASNSSLNLQSKSDQPGHFVAADSSTPDQFLKNLKSNAFDYLTMIHYEDCRINHHIGRLKSLKIAVRNKFNPLIINLTRYFRNVPDMDIKESRCSVCGSISSWECFLCQKPFCKSKECSKQNFFDDCFYFNQPSVVCDKCLATFQNYRNEFNNLLLGYKSFVYLENPIEAENNKFLLSYINSQKQKKINQLSQEFLQNKTAGETYIIELSFEQRRQQILHQKVENDPSKYPSAFFIDSQNPSLNLLLTDEGTSITSSEWGKRFICFTLGCKMNISSIYIKGSDDCVIQITESEGKSKIMNLSPNQENICEGLCGRLLSLNLVSGTLNSIYVKGKEMQRTVERQKTHVQNPVHYPPKLKFMKTKNAPVNYAKIVSADIGKEKDITGVLLQNFYGIYSVLIVVYKVYGSKPVKVLRRFLSKSDDNANNDFLVLFKRPVRGTRVDVQIIDSGSIKEPKVMII